MQEYDPNELKGENTCRIAQEWEQELNKQEKKQVIIEVDPDLPLGKQSSGWVKFITWDLTKLAAKKTILIPPAHLLIQTPSLGGLLWYDSKPSKWGTQNL